MGFINICNNPLNPKFHISLATFTWKSNLKTLSTPLLKGEIFENDTFKTAYSISIKYLLVCTQHIATGKNVRRKWKKIKNMGFINICNNPLNLKFHILLATFTYKSNMETLSTPSSGARYLDTIIFGHLIQYPFNICLFALKILRQGNILGYQT